jgi:hypothetical protein
LLIHEGSSSHPEKNPPSGILYLAQKDRLILCTEKIQMVTEEEFFDETTGQAVPGKIVLKASEENCKLKCSFNVQRVVERDHLHFSGWKTHNWRFLDGYKANITLDGKKTTASGQMLHEKFLLRLK